MESKKKPYEPPKAHRIKINIEESVLTICINANTSGSQFCKGKVCGSPAKDIGAGS